MSKAFADFLQTFKLSEVWIYLATDDVLARYKRTIFGPLWNTGYIIFTSIALSIVFGALFHQSLSITMPYILSGMIIWNFLAIQILDSASIFTIYAGTVRTSNFPFFFYVMRNIFRMFLFFLHNLVAFLVICPIVGHIPWISWSMIPALILGVAITVPYSMLFGMAGARYRDLLQLSANLSGLFFFLTPIFWNPDGITGIRRAIIQYNPFYYIVELVRLPLLNLMPGPQIWLGCLLILLFGVALCLLVFSKFRARIPFWV